MRFSLARAALFAFPLFVLPACLSVPEGQFPVHGADTGVIVHNYAMAFRDFLRSASHETLIPIQVGAPLPIGDQEWYADNATAPGPMTTSVAGVESVSRVECGDLFCRRTIERTFHDGFRLDETLEIYYRRGATDTAGDDRILGFTSLVRYPDQVLSQSAATEPEAGKPWVITTQYGFSAEDGRQTVIQTAEYAELVSGASPAAASLTYRTKDTATEATYAADSDGWEYSQNVTFEESRLTLGSLHLSATDDAVKGEQKLTYSSGVAISPLRLEGDDTWSFTGETVALGSVSGKRSADGWERTIQFPAGQRFKTLADQGTWPSHDNRGSFRRVITGQEETLTIEGTYRLKAPGVWELNASAEGGIRIEMTFQSLPLADVWQGTWVQSNSRSSNLDAASFTITAHPDWTSQMNYTYDRADTPFTPDESGTIRMTPDSRGTAKVSVVNEKSGGEQRHVDYTLRIVAEGQKP
jgi:hypothetical protein